MPPAPPRSMFDADTSTPLPPTTANAPRTPMCAALSIARAMRRRASEWEISTFRVKVQESMAVTAEHWGRRPRDWAELAEPSNEPLFATVLDRLGVDADTRLLDIGCGSGYAAAMAAARGASLTGIDITPELIEIARERVPAGHFVVGGMDRSEERRVGKE